ncbi:MAG TPA: Do family serine endopeptidase [Geminicoccaceae bacterium]|nr:Do family serine endopeptidase [Geminicoccaceae bacterium]
MTTVLARYAPAPAEIARGLAAAMVRAALVLTAPVLAGADVSAAHEVPRSREQIALSFAPVVREAAPAVVNIYTLKERHPSAANPFLADPFFRFFFEDFGGDRLPRPAPENSLGSGVIVDRDGLIVTNHHVIEDADQIMVVLSDRREFRAELVGADEAADLALLDIEADELPALPLGDSDLLEVGDLVLAIGNPFGIGQTVTSGIVSAVARSTPDGRSDLSFIQTDAAINPGNSGGALVTVDGRLVGINTAIFTRGGGSIGIGFAIPVNLVKALIRSVQGGGEGLQRPWLGARIQSVDASLASALGLERPLGVVVNQVHPSGPAARAGLAQGDVILAIGGRDVPDAKALNFRLALGTIGESTELRVQRNGHALTLDLPLETPPYDPMPEVSYLDGRHALAGATVANLSPGLNRDLGLDLFQAGVIVLEVERGSPAARLGLGQGDLIRTVAEARIDDVATLKAAIAAQPLPWRIEVERAGRRLAVVIGG